MANLYFLLNSMASIEKLTIKQNIAQSFADNSYLGISFFFKKSKGNRGTVSRFFTTIITNLMIDVPDLVLSILKVINADSAISKKALKNQFKKLIL